MQCRGTPRKPQPWSCWYDFALSLELLAFRALGRNTAPAEQEEEISRWRVWCWDLQSSEVLPALLTLRGSLVRARHVCKGSWRGSAEVWAVRITVRKHRQSPAARSWHGRNPDLPGRLRTSPSDLLVKESADQGQWDGPDPVCGVGAVMAECAATSSSTAEGAIE